MMHEIQIAQGRRMTSFRFLPSFLILAAALLHPVHASAQDLKADGSIEFARLRSCQNNTRCLIHGEFDSGMDVTLLSRDGHSQCRGKTVGANNISNEAAGPITATTVRLQNCSTKASYFLAVMGGQVRSFKVANIQRIRHSDQERAIESVVRRYSVLDPEKYEQDPQTRYQNRLLRNWQPPNDEQITVVARQDLALYSYRVDSVDARLVVFAGGSPHAVNGPTVFVRDGAPAQVTGIFYHDTYEEADKSMIGFSLNGELFLYVSGSWCEGCGHHGVELHRFEQGKSTLVYQNADGST